MIVISILIAIQSFSLVFAIISYIHSKKAGKILETAKNIDKEIADKSAKNISFDLIKNLAEIGVNYRNACVTKTKALYNLWVAYTLLALSAVGIIIVIYS